MMANVFVSISYVVVLFVSICRVKNKRFLLLDVLKIFSAVISLNALVLIKFFNVFKVTICRWC